MPVERICISAMSEHRRASKPIMEKRRRARINNSLTELKSLILDATRKDCSRHSKLEKADILEMTVKHLQTMQRQQMASAVSTDPTVLTKFKSGFTECAAEISRYLNSIESVDKNVRQRILAHLGTCLTGLHSYLTPLTFAPPPVGFPSPYFSGPTAAAHHLMTSRDIRSVPGNMPMMMPGSRGGPPQQHFFPASGSPIGPHCGSTMSDQQSCGSPCSSSPSLSPFTPNTPLSPMSNCSKMSDSDPVWRPW